MASSFQDLTHLAAAMPTRQRLKFGLVGSDLNHLGTWEHPKNIKGGYSTARLGPFVGMYFFERRISQF